MKNEKNMKIDEKLNFTGEHASIRKNVGID
jgi:hypothetical protein